LPRAIFDIDIAPSASGPQQIVKGMDVPVSYWADHKEGVWAPYPW